MKKIFILIFISSLGITEMSSQSLSCQELFEIVTSEYDSKDQVTCFNSTMLTKASFYKLEGHGFVVGYLKSSDYDFSGKPYISCGISSARWRSFKSDGMVSSWGESFHKYIREYTCNCY